MSKKFILFIVEGKNDEREINAMLHSPFFSQYIDKYDIRFQVVGNDITAKADVTPKNIQGKLNDLVLKFRRDGIPFSNIKVSEIQEIVQVVDVDGAFIPAERIIRDDTCSSDFHYEEDCIKTTNIYGAVGRNKKKSEIIRKLIQIEKVGDIPYSVYFVSCNMDHLLNNIRNPKKQDKDGFSWHFQKMCKEDADYLRGSVFNQRFSAIDYTKSWEDIQIECNSLQRMNNFNLFFGVSAKNNKP